MARSSNQTAPAAAAGAVAAAGGAAAVVVKRARDHRARRTEAERARAFRLRRAEDTGDGVRRIARGQLDLAGSRLDAGTGLRGDLDGAVHETRKAFKRLRALVRLSRDALGDEAYRRENTIFRDAGRRLSGARDAAVLVQTLDGLAARYRAELGDDAFAGLRAALASEAEAASGALSDDRTAVDQVQGTLEAARRRVGGWPLPDDGGLAMLAPGFERIYRRGRRALQVVRKEPDTETLHELRKRAKDLWHAAQVLRPAAPKARRRGARALGPPAQVRRPAAPRAMKEPARRPPALSEVVGDAPALAVRRAAARERHAPLARGELALLERLIARRRARLQR